MTELIGGLSNGYRCLVVGGSGFIGSHVSRRLAQQGCQVTVLGRPSSNFDRLSGTGARQLRGDFSNPAFFRSAVEEHDCVIHLMGATVPRTSMRDPVFDINANVIPTMHLLQEAHRAGIKKIIFASSGGTVYGAPASTPISEDHPTNPLSVYGVCKLTIEKMLSLWNDVYGMSNIILRLSNVYGEDQPAEGSFGAISVFLNKIRKDEQITIWGDGSVVRDYVHVEDVANAFLRALAIEPLKGYPATFNVGSGAGVSLNEIINMISQITGKTAKVRYETGNPIDVPINILDIGRAQRILGYAPSITLEEGINRLHKHMSTKVCL